MSNTERKKKKIKVKNKNKQEAGILGIVTYIVIIMLTASYLFTFVATNKNVLFGYTARIVVTGSMEPEIAVNSISIIKVCGIDEINEGDIICFNYSQDIIHRVVTKTVNESGLEVVHTKGDANEFVDSIEVNSDMIVGKVIYVFNGTSKFIDKYSIRPGELDGTTLSKDIVLGCCAIGLFIWLMGALLNLIGIAYKTFSRRDRLKGATNMYLSDMDSLVVYRDILNDLIENAPKNTKDTRFEYYGNKIAKVMAEAEILKLHTELRSFKKKIKYCMYIHRLGTLLDRDSKQGKKPDMSISDIIRYCKEYNEEHENKHTD